MVEKKKHPHWGVQVRTLEVFFDDNPENPRLYTDVWVKFGRCGDVVLRPGTIKMQGIDSTPVSFNFVDDQLMVMSEKIFEAMQLPMDEFNSSDQVLSLQRYEQIGMQICKFKHCGRVRLVRIQISSRRPKVGLNQPFHNFLHSVGTLTYQAPTYQRPVE